MNSQEFTDAPAALRQPRRSQSQIRVSRTAGLPLDPNGPYLAAAEGLFNHAIAVGTEILRFTGAFLRGRRFFSSQTSLSIRLSLRRSTARRFGFRLGHRLSPQPLDRFFRLLSKDGLPRFRCFLITIRRIGLSSAGIAPRSWTASFGFDPSSSVTLACSGLPVGGRIPPGGYPSPLCSSIAGVFRGIASLSVYGLGSESQARPSTKFVRPRLRMFLFQGFPHLPFSLDSLAVRVSWRWRSSF